jgi:hypothetical protein
MPYGAGCAPADVHARTGFGARPDRDLSLGELFPPLDAKSAGSWAIAHNVGLGEKGAKTSEHGTTRLWLESAARNWMMAPAQAGAWHGR